MDDTALSINSQDTLIDNKSINLINNKSTHPISYFRRDFIFKPISNVSNNNTSNKSGKMPRIYNEFKETGKFSLIFLILNKVPFSQWLILG